MAEMRRGGVLFRVDGSRELGLGHIVRCISLATALKNERGSDFPINFAVKEYDGYERLFSGSGFEANIFPLPVRNDQAVFREILNKLRPGAVIADIDLRGKVERFLETIYPRPVLVSLHEHNYSLLQGDIVIAPTVKPLELAKGGTPGVTHFTGAEYVILSPDISELREQVKKSSAKVEKGFVSLGGGDPSGNTSRILESIKWLNFPDISWEVILGPASGIIAENSGADMPSNILLINGAELSRKEFLSKLANSDLAITNGGTTLYEALALGKPVMAMSQNEFERDVILKFENDGACIDLTGMSNESIVDSVLKAILNPQIRDTMGSKGIELIDAQGSSRIAALISARVI